MTKEQQRAFNKALISTVKSKDRVYVPDNKSKRYVAFVPVSTVLKNFKKFTDKVNKDLDVKKNKK